MVGVGQEQDRDRNRAGAGDDCAFSRIELMVKRRREHPATWSGQSGGLSGVADSRGGTEIWAEGCPRHVYNCNEEIKRQKTNNQEQNMQISRSGIGEGG